MTNKYLDINTKFNKNTFNVQEFFDIIQEFLFDNKIPTDDLKANISFNEYEPMSDADWDKGEFQVSCLFSWIFYPIDIPKEQFKNVAENIEQLFKDQFKLSNYNVDCIRYDDSEYSSDGYDVELKLYINYGLDEN